MQEKKALTREFAVCNMYALRQGCPSGAPAFSVIKAYGEPEFTAVINDLSKDLRRKE